ncbi:PhzF family phenazine biosynthesis protein [Stenotrophomonas sp. SY1]|uniref:PhzF family phenazine biosynthesis protein n=1 Tax=Stenotrophomonas sp. SY1 TaxID=477235 RepID=UPI001E30AF9C|nr:PhzF family phenazine biosynthesis protein [Stenotrophomonas sp. SY1]MCD9087726.1 PhzF family phenazine biosynthesis protein [Stenotrophomonas sp. SY1]
MTARRYLQLDVFAAHAGAGNPLGVILDSQGLDTSAMQAIAAWLDLSETVFFLPPDEGASYRIRIFTPSSELPFAGHPSVGAAWAAVTCGIAEPHAGALVQQCAAGRLSVRVTGPADAPTIQLASPAAGRLPTLPGAVPAQIQALAASGHVPELWDNGPRWWLVPARDASSVRALLPDMNALADWTNATHATGVAVFAPEAGTDHNLVVRAFCPADAGSVPEDPVTGSANALIGAWLHRHGQLPGTGGRYVVSQGREVGRDGRVQVSVDAQGTVWIGGQVQRVIDGQVRW